MPFCTNCGKPVKENFKFCQSCGVPVETAGTPEKTAFPPAAAENPVPPAAPISPATSGFQTPVETIKAIIPNLMVSKSWGRSDAYNLIVTEHRSIFAKLTADIMKATINERRDQAAAEGKGFFGKWAAQMKSFNTYTDHYKGFTPEQVLNETEGNYAIENSMIRKVKAAMDMGDEASASVCRIEIETVTGKLKFQTQYNAEKMFKQVYG